MNTSDYTAQIREKAKDLLLSGEADCVIGYERASDGLTARPRFAYRADEVEDLIFDQTCVHNLVKYLLDRKGKRTAVVAKPCDSRAVNLLLSEKQISREDVFVIGVVCDGVLQGRWSDLGEKPQSRCQTCPQRMPVVYDFLVGEPPTGELLPMTYEDVEESAALSPEERERFWSEQFSRCLRCYACRQACPGCYCTECFVERLDPEWVGIRIDEPEKWMWNVVRAYHLAGRCIDCDQCQRVCPVDIPLRLLNRKLEREVARLFSYTPGLSPEEPGPLITFSKEDKLGIGE